MKLYLLKKEKNRVYDSQSICKEALDFNLKYDGEKPLGCSISDTKNYWACCIGKCGIDIEENGREVKENIVNHLHPDEKKYLSALNFGGSEWNTEFLHIWTEKEAVFKLTGKRFKEYSVFDDRLEYRPMLDYYHVVDMRDKNLTYCVISEDDFVEICEIKYQGKAMQSCTDCAADLLGRKPFSKAELKIALEKKGYSAEEIKTTLSSLEELGYINDQDYAKRYADKLLERGKGSAYIKSKLLQKGINKDDMPLIDSKAQYESALTLAKSLYLPTQNYPEKKKMMDKIARKLSSQGFESSVIFKVLDSFN